MNLRIVRERTSEVKRTAEDPGEAVRAATSVTGVRSTDATTTSRNQLPPHTLPGSKQVRFDAYMSLETPGTKTWTAVKGADGEVIDYRDVQIKGYLSTWDNLDRDGERVGRGAFSATIKQFMENPVLLVGHKNNVDDLVGRFTVVREDDKGLYVEALLSNAPDVQSVRYKVAEGVLRTMSMGGVFYYGEAEGFRTINRVDLFEGSLTPIPANPRALVSTRELTESERVKAASVVGA